MSAEAEPGTLSLSLTEINSVGSQNIQDLPSLQLLPALAYLLSCAQSEGCFLPEAIIWPRPYEE